jgi:NAD(P)-dependent dehydrogenase (short-subunit alcohol dehydrogenase family)
MSVEVVETDLATTMGVDELIADVRSRPVAALLANAGHGLGHAFLDQEFEEARHVIDTNVTGTVYLIHNVGRDMRKSRGWSHSHHGINRRVYTRNLSGHLQWHEGFHGFLLLRIAGQTQELGRYCNMPNAGCYRYRVLQKRRYVGHESWDRQER